MPYKIPHPARFLILAAKKHSVHNLKEILSQSKDAGTNVIPMLTIGGKKKDLVKHGILGKSH